MNILDSVSQDYLKKDIPAFNVGDQVRVHNKIKDFYVQNIHFLKKVQYVQYVN